ncbi:MAG: protein kinase, partial [Thermoanaerobaculia bacterium]
MTEDLSALTASGPFGLPTASITLLAPGTSVGGRYRIEGVLGSGGYAVVYVAFDRELERMVALKILRPERASGEGLMRFRREVAVARGISSPRLVRVFDIGASDNAIYLTMELIEGESLKERLRRGPLTVEESIGISSAILEGLDALHSAGVIHRDVKPGNVLLGRSGEIKLADFGLARSELETSGVTHSGALLGTSEYVSPEQALGRDIEARSDLYSLGILMYETLTGRLPFPAESALGILLERLKNRAPDPRALNSQVPRWLSRLILRLMERRPADRYASAHAVLEDLHRRKARVRVRPSAGVLAATGLLLLGSIGFGAKQHFDGTRFSHLSSLSPDGIAAVSRSGATLWSVPEVEPDTTGRYAMVRTERGGHPLIAMVLRKPSEWNPVDGHTLSLVDPQTGKIVKRIALPRGDLGFPEASIHFGVDQIDAIDLDGDGIDEVIGSYISYPGIASYIFLYEPRIERSRLLFQANGHHRFATAADLDGNGSPELVLSGINNLLGWYSAAAAIRIIPPVNEAGLPAPTASPDLITGPAEEGSLLWYALLPRHPLNTPQHAFFDASRGRLEFPLPGGASYILSSDGFAEGSSGTDAPEHSADARRRAYAHLREASRTEATGTVRAAVAAIDRAVAEALESGDEVLLEAVRRQRARLLVIDGSVEKGEAAFEELIASSSNRPEIAFQAGEAHHVVGRLDDAIRWYRRGLVVAGDAAEGKPKFAYLEGMVLALVEEKRWNEALEVASSFYSAYGGAGYWPGMYREFIFWRMGQRPKYEGIQMSPALIESVRYWALEFRNSDGDDPSLLLPELDRALWSGPMRPLIDSLRAEVFFRQGRGEEAVLEARRAQRLAQEESRRVAFLRPHLE